MHQSERVRQSLIGLEFVVVHSWMSSPEDEKGGPSGNVIIFPDLMQTRIDSHRVDAAT